MTTLMIDAEKVSIPTWVVDFPSFQRWADEPDFPEKANIWWLNGGVWADMSMEQIFTHLDVKGEYYRVLANLMVETGMGRVFTDGLRLFNELAELSGKPDLTFISRRALEERRAWIVPGKEGGFTQLHGSPDMVLEVLSASSWEKDLVTLREDYFTAGVLEYWLVDARKNPPNFDILRRNASGFVTTRKQGGWLKSAVFGKSFRLARTNDDLGMPVFRLEVR